MYSAIVFNNIDGNSSNFDSLAVDLSQYTEQFSILAVAETNVNETDKNLYPINGYISEYNSKIFNKSKGSGLGMYIREDIQHTRMEQFCSCTPNVEYMFIEICNSDNKKPKCVGVVYRPPSGSENLALQELDLLMKNLPNENVTITGDFNIDLLSKHSDFEQILYSNNFIPLISIATHEKPGCKGSLIDNILTNSTDNFLSSGVLESRVSHHHPVFCCFNSCNGVPKQPDTPTPPHYDYCQTNISKFLDDLLTMV